MSMPPSPTRCAARHARSLLFVPATRPERFAKAHASAADCIIIDLEDAVGAASKDSARAQLAQHLPHWDAAQRARTVVRVNAIDTPWHATDLALLRDWTPHGVTVMLPKSEDADALRQVARQLGDAACIVALIESLAGLDAVDALAREPGVVRLAFGHLDFQLDLGMHASPDEPELAVARHALVAASRRAGLPAPIDGVTLQTGDDARLAGDARRARAFGFGGKLCIHPDQVAGVNAALGYSDDERAWARRVLDAAARHGGEVFTLEGRMVDRPVIRAAERMLANEGS
jgi:citrate lyase subunit beta / citryl-CoA lyase